MSNLINIPSNIVLPEDIPSDNCEAIFDEFENKLKDYCKNNSSCVDAGKTLDFFHDENSDSDYFYPAVYMIFDYDNLIHVPTWYAYKSNNETLSALNEFSIPKLLKLQDEKNKQKNNGSIPF
jgi:hypothetical protein